MQISAGWAKGMTLKSPQGDATRPTSSKIRAAIMNILAHELEDARILDLCAGSGALAFEALSRGAESAVLIDGAAGAISALKANKASLTKRAEAQGLTAPKVDIRSLDVQQIGKALRTQGAFSLVFFDPPYRKAVELLSGVVLHLAGVLADGGVLVFESAATDQADIAKVFQTHSEYFSIESERFYGDTAITIVSRNEGGRE